MNLYLKITWRPQVNLHLGASDYIGPLTAEEAGSIVKIYRAMTAKVKRADVIRRTE